MKHDFKVTVNVTPHEDGVHCGKCKCSAEICAGLFYVQTYRYCQIPQFRRGSILRSLETTEESGKQCLKRCPACIKAEKASRE